MSMKLPSFAPSPGSLGTCARPLPFMSRERLEDVDEEYAGRGATSKFRILRLELGLGILSVEQGGLLMMMRW